MLSDMELFLFYFLLAGRLGWSFSCCKLSYATAPSQSQDTLGCDHSVTSCLVSLIQFCCDFSYKMHQYSSRLGSWSPKCLDIPIILMQLVILLCSFYLWPEMLKINWHFLYPDSISSISGTGVMSPVIAVVRGSRSTWIISLSNLSVTTGLF